MKRRRTSKGSAVILEVLLLVLLLVDVVCRVLGYCCVSVFDFDVVIVLVDIRITV